MVSAKIAIVMEVGDLVINKFYHTQGGSSPSFYGRRNSSLHSASNADLFCKRSPVYIVSLLILLLIFALVVFTACDADIATTWTEDDKLLFAQTPTHDAYSITEKTNKLPCKYINEETNAEQKYTEENTQIEVAAIHSPPELGPEPKPPRYKIAITFDDGPSRFTPDILDILEQHNSRATFFVLGTHIQAGADTILRAAQHGNEIAGHSWNHVSFTNLDESGIREQIQNTSAAIEDIIGSPSSQIFRPPFGVVNSRVRRVSRELGYKIVNWSIDPEDWRIRDADHIYDFIMENAVHGAIIVLHDIYSSTTEAMARLVPSLIENGFELVTASELLDYLFEDLVPGGLYFGLRK